ncbi:hypothetical protein C1646_755939 [Rhizophagus diaphanus]|nr:hypothetical protein C1646_755939 [Rhizophagus diaphanus] [Rhizophagus sp. MUCL 43196]
MTDTLISTKPDMNETVLDMNELQKEVIRSIECFSQISKIRVEDNFIQEKINQISKQKVEFRNFAEESISQSLKMCGYAEDLIVFAECWEDGISKEELKESLSSLLNDSKSYKSEATLLKKQIENIKNSLSGIDDEISEYNEKITEERKVLSNHIDTEDKLTDDAKSYATRGKIVAGIGVITAAIAASFTGGASLVAFGLGSFAFVGGAATAERYTTVVETSSNKSIILNYQLESVREEFSQYIRVMCNGLKAITNIISYCESHWEKQIDKTEDIIQKLESGEKKIEKTEDIIQKLESGEKQMNKIIAKSILTKAKKTLESSEGYSLSIRQVLNKDLMLTEHNARENEPI